MIGPAVTDGRGPDTHIFWAADSTVQTNDIETWPQTGIGQMLPLYLREGAAVSNHARNGRSTKSFLDEGRLDPIREQLRPGDFLFVQFGHNDAKREDPARYADAFGAYTENLLLFIETARSKGATPVLITPLYRRRFDRDGSLIPGSHGEYPRAMRELAARENVACVDLCGASHALIAKTGDDASRQWFMHLEPGEYPAYPDGSIDDTHLVVAGAAVFAGLIARGLWDLGDPCRSLLHDNPDFLPPAPF